MKSTIRNRIIRFFATVIALALGYLICAHAFLFLHGMGQWPIILLVFGLIMIGIAALLDSRRAMYFTVGGYVTGFVLAMAFNWDTYDPNAMSYRNNSWVIWTVVFLSFIVVGFIWDCVIKHVKKRDAL